MMEHVCLSIAGFDGSGGAGIQADLKVFSALGCYGMTVLTALPVQNTCGVRNCYSIPLVSIEEQLEAIFDDIIPTCIKIGMLFSPEIVELVADFISKHAGSIPVILDPVMVAKSGDTLLVPGAIDVLKRKLLPLSYVVTPNLHEAYVLLGGFVEEPEIIASKIIELGAKSVLVKGGHGISESSDDLFLNSVGDKHWFRTARVDSKNTHGTGCSMSAAICSFIAHGFSEAEACMYAKYYVLRAISHSKHDSVGLGNGPIQHFYHLWPCLNKVMEGCSWHL